MLVRSTRFAAACAVLALARIAAAQIPTPTLEGPVTSPGSAFVQTTTFDLADVGYVQEEYFVSGTARAYTASGALGEDGAWTAARDGATADYKTRIVVYRPASRKAFNGTVLIEWLNVSGGVDAGPDWSYAHTELIRSGYAWVGVSAQYVGVEGGGGLVGLGIDLSLKKQNPARYGSLHHPGDSFSYDMYSQVAQAIRTPGAPKPLGDLKAKRVIAIGESQSAFRLVTYVNAIHPTTHLFDGFFIHSRGGGGAQLSQDPQPEIDAPGTVLIRADVDVPVLTFETETDLGFLNYFPARQDDAKNFRLWEVAGTSHADSYLLVAGPKDVGDDPNVVALAAPASPLPGIIDCAEPINSGPQHFVVKAAVAALDKWVRRGKAPKSAPRLDVSAGPPVTINRDANGVALGGIRTPQVDVPIAAFGPEQAGAIICRLFGTTTTFSPAQLAALYPTHRDFVSAYGKAIRRAVKAGWVRKPDAKLMKKWAAASGIGG